MKKILLGLLLISSSVCAQDKVKKLYIGPKANINVAYLNNDSGYLTKVQSNSYENYIRSSIGVGVSAEYFTNPIFSLQAELLYMPKGGGVRRENSSVVYLGNQGAETAYYIRYYQLNYIEMPMLMKITFNPNRFQQGNSEAPRFQMMFGPAISFNTRSAIKANDFQTGSGYGLVDVNESWDTEEYDKAKSTISNIVWGFELQYPTDLSQVIFFDLRLTQSLGSVYEPEGYSLYRQSRDKVSNTTFSLGGGIKF